MPTSSARAPRWCISRRTVPRFMPATPAISRRRCRRRQPVEPRSVHQHHQPAGNSAQQSGAAGTLPLFQHRHGPEGASRPRCRGRHLLQDRDGHDRRRAVRPGGGAHPVQLGARIQRRRGVQGQVPNGNFKAYANFSYGITKAIGPVSNQYLLDADEYAYLLNNYHYTDDMQHMTGRRARPTVGTRRCSP